MSLTNFGVNALDRHLTSIVQYYNVKYLGDRLRPAIVRGQIAGLERAISLSCDVLAITTVALGAIGSLSLIPTLLLWGTFASTSFVAFEAYDRKTIDIDKLIRDYPLLGTILRSTKAFLMIFIRENP